MDGRNKEQVSMEVGVFGGVAVIIVPGDAMVDFKILVF